MAIEADRMRNLWLRDADRNAEMTVVRNEYEHGENDPNSALYKEVIATAYLAQPYHHSTIGWRSDIEKVPTSKLREFYDTFYWPDNATVTIVGDVEPAKALALVKKYYGAIPHSPQPIPEMYTEEPAQTGPRRVIVKRAGELGSLIIAYKAPNGARCGPAGAQRARRSAESRREQPPLEGADGQIADDLRIGGRPAFARPRPLHGKRRPRAGGEA